MDTGFKYQLERYSSMKQKHKCPRCGKRTFVRYIDTDGNYVGDDVGRCDREAKCGYLRSPDGNGTITNGFIYKPVIPTFLREKDISLSQYQDELYHYLTGLYSEEDVKRVFSKYLVRSTNTKWKNSTIFYQKDLDGRYRTGKIILYDKLGKRVKQPYSHIYWVHNSITDFDFQLEQCLFGEHLLDSFNQKNGNIYLVESEKTCLVCSLEYPNDLFIASGGLSNLNSKKLSVLRNYIVGAIPDKGAYEYWKTKLEPFGIATLTIMEDVSFMKDGEDIADFLLKNKNKL